MSTAFSSQNKASNSQVLHEESFSVMGGKEGVHGTGSDRFRQLLEFFEDEPERNPNLTRHSISSLASPRIVGISPTERPQALNYVHVGSPSKHILGTSSQRVLFRPLAQNSKPSAVPRPVAHFDNTGKPLPHVAETVSNTETFHHGVLPSPSKLRHDANAVNADGVPVSSSESSDQTFSKCNRGTQLSSKKGGQAEKSRSNHDGLQSDVFRRYNTGLKRAANIVRSFSKALYKKLKMKLFPDSPEPLHAESDKQALGKTEKSSLLNSASYERTARENDASELQGLGRAEAISTFSQQPTPISEVDREKLIDESERNLKETSGKTQSSNLSAVQELKELVCPALVQSLVGSECTETSRITPLSSLERTKSLCLARDGSNITDHQPASPHPSHVMPPRARSSASTGTRRVFSLTSNVSVYTGANVEEAAMNINVDDGSEGVLDPATRSLRFTGAGTVVDSLYGKHGFRTPHESHALLVAREGPLLSS